MPGVLDSHNWGGDDDSGWINSSSGIVSVYGGKKYFGQDQVPGPWDVVGHAREKVIDFAPNVTFQQVMAVTKDTYTNLVFGVRTDPSFFVQGCAGVYFGAYQTGALEAFLWDVNTNNTSSIRIPLVKNKDYTARIVTMEDGKIEAFIGKHSLGVSANWGSVPYTTMHGMLAFSECGNGTGLAVIDNYKVSQ